MFAGEGESRPGVVVERRRFPRARGVAKAAILRETGRDVIGAGGLLEFREMARRALRRDARIFPSNVARGACDARMFAAQGEFRPVMVERGRGPAACRMAGLACGWEIRCDVVRISRLLEV